ncbi:MAG: OmpH family outer membrane protein [Amaricoccus sp.]
MVGVVFAVALLAAGGLAAQERVSSPFLFVNQERILTGSKTGQKVLADEETARDALRSDARAIDSAFEAEERQLNELRKTMSAEAFRAKADDFDARVVKARQDQDARSNALAQDLDQRRRQFYATVAPILVKVMDRYHAHAIFDENSVLLADETLNITSDVIAEVDAQGPQGLALSPAPPDGQATEGAGPGPEPRPTGAQQ